MALDFIIIIIIITPTTTVFGAFGLL